MHYSRYRYVVIFAFSCSVRMCMGEGIDDFLDILRFWKVVSYRVV